MTPSLALLLMHLHVRPLYQKLPLDANELDSTLSFLKTVSLDGVYYLTFAIFYRTI